MKLYRHHSKDFQEQIAKGEFVKDMSRRFNNTGKNKNEAEFYFYSASAKDAQNYATEETELFCYESYVKLLDLRVMENRILLTETIEAFILIEEDTKKSMRENVAEKYLEPLAKKATTKNDILNDVRVDSSSFWGQRATDFEMGVVLKNQLIKLGFDGVIFQDTISTEIALLNPAKSI